jgi:hypothetical protein
MAIAAREQDGDVIGDTVGDDAGMEVKTKGSWR